MHVADLHHLGHRGFDHFVVPMADDGKGCTTTRIKNSSTIFQIKYMLHADSTLCGLSMSDLCKRTGSGLRLRAFESVVGDAVPFVNLVEMAEISSAMGISRIAEGAILGDVSCGSQVSCNEVTDCAFKQRKPPALENRTKKRCDKIWPLKTSPTN
jgi:hypothetical protein